MHYTAVLRCKRFPGDQSPRKFSVVSSSQQLIVRFIPPLPPSTSRVPPLTVPLPHSSCRPPRASTSSRGGSIPSPYLLHPRRSASKQHRLLIQYRSRNHHPSMPTCRTCHQYLSQKSWYSLSRIYPVLSIPNAASSILRRYPNDTEHWPSTTWRGSASARPAGRPRSALLLVWPRPKLRPRPMRPTTPTR